MGIQVTSVLAEHHSTLTSSSGVELQPCVDEYGEDIELPDSIEQPSQNRGSDTSVVCWTWPSRPPTTSTDHQLQQCLSSGLQIKLYYTTVGYFVSFHMFMCLIS